jgi:hypothetical protein
MASTTASTLRLPNEVINATEALAAAVASARSSQPPRGVFWETPVAAATRKVVVSAVNAYLDLSASSILHSSTQTSSTTAALPPRLVANIATALHTSATGRGLEGSALGPAFLACVRAMCFVALLDSPLPRPHDALSMLHAADKALGAFGVVKLPKELRAVATAASPAVDGLLASRSVANYAKNRSPSYRDGTAFAIEHALAACFILHHLLPDVASSTG